MSSASPAQPLRRSLDRPVRVVVVGAGPIGLACAAAVKDAPDLQLCGVVDVDPARAGVDAGALLGGLPWGVTVRGSLDEVKDAEVAVVATASTLVKVEATLIDLCGRGLDVVSTCEELVWPWSRADVAARIHAAAKHHGTSVIGTGVNPGFVMDLMPALFSSVSRRVDRVTVARVQDAGPRRGPFRDKVGVGLDVDAFAVRAAQSDGGRNGSFGHVGLVESAQLLAAGLGVTLDDIQTTMAPVVDRVARQSAGVVVAAGRVAGVEQTCTGSVAGRVVVELLFRASVGEADPRDQIDVAGDPPLSLRIAGAVPGDSATAAIIAHAVTSVRAAAPGLRTMLEVPPPTGRFGPR